METPVSELLAFDELGVVPGRSRDSGTGRSRATPIGEGASNLTYLVERGGARVVLRRPPPPPLPPSAHDVIREARIKLGLAPAGVRVPRVLAVCEDESIIGAPFYLMEELRRDGVERRGSPTRARHHGGAPARRGGAAGRPRGAPRGRLGGGWADDRQAHGLPRAPAAALERPVGGQRHPRARICAWSSARGSRRRCRRARPRRSFTGTTASGT